MTAETEIKRPKNAQEILSEHDEKMVYLGMGREMYKPAYEAKTPDADHEENRLAKLLTPEPGKPETGKIEREKMANNFAKLLKRVEELTPEKLLRNFPDVLRELVLEIKQEEINEISDPDPEKQEEKKKRQQEMFDFLKDEEKPGSLMNHLAEAKRATTRMMGEIIGNQQGTDVFMTPRQAELMSLFVAEVHDLLKFMGSPAAQIDSDHEHLMKFLLQTIQESGKQIKVDGLGSTFDHNEDENAALLTADDLKFAGGVMSFHEDIWREKVFEDQVTAALENVSQETGGQSIESQIDRGIGVFHVIDLFGTSLSFQEVQGAGSGSGAKELCLKPEDEKVFIDRFVDLFRRHIRMPISPVIEAEGQKKGVDWTRGKVTRPEWGLHAIASINNVLNSLSEKNLLSVNSQVPKLVEGGVILVLLEAQRDATSEVDKLKMSDAPDAQTKITQITETLSRVEKILQDLGTQFPLENLINNVPQGTLIRAQLDTFGMARENRAS